MIEVVWTKRYLRELSEIADYLAERNPDAAARIVRDIHSKTKTLLSSNPFIGRPGEIDDTRELVLPASGYIVAYRVRDERVEVLFVQHGAKEWPRDIS